MAKQRYPIGIQTFSEIRKGEYVYADKTDLVYQMTHDFKYVFLSRPRRFGKSLLTSTLASYFRGERDYFKGLAIDQLEKEWTQYPVFQFSLATAKLGTIDDLNEQLNVQFREYEEEWNIKNTSHNNAARLQNLVITVYKQTGLQCIVLIDEYDAPLLTVLHDPQRLTVMREALQSFYSPLKDLDTKLRFVFITGITKFSQLSIFSQLNNLANISMLPDYATVCGITQQELETNFKEGIAVLADKEQTTDEEILREMKSRYDGYHFARESDGVYNPFSVLSAFQTKQLDNYWFATGTPTFLVNMLRKYHTDLTTLDGSIADASDFDKSTENMQDVLPLFYQSGYLTIKGYKRMMKRYILGYPNQEVKAGLMECLIPSYVNTTTWQAGCACADICEALLGDDVDQALSAARSFFAGIPYQEGTLKDAPAAEGHFTAMLYVMFSFLNRYVYSQVRTAKGRMDILVMTDTTVFVMELKMDGSVDEALQQINSQGYAIPYEADGRKVIKVGINFSSEERTITDWKVGD